jgi:hypothetical protein
MSPGSTNSAAPGGMEPLLSRDSDSLGDLNPGTQPGTRLSMRMGAGGLGHVLELSEHLEPLEGRVDRGRASPASWFKRPRAEPRLAAPRTGLDVKTGVKPAEATTTPRAPHLGRLLAEAAGHPALLHSALAAW